MSSTTCGKITPSGNVKIISDCSAGELIKFQHNFGNKIVDALGIILSSSPDVQVLVLSQAECTTLPMIIRHKKSDSVYFSYGTSWFIEPELNDVSAPTGIKSNLKLGDIIIGTKKIGLVVRPLDGEHDVQVLVNLESHKTDQFLSLLASIISGWKLWRCEKDQKTDGVDPLLVHHMTESKGLVENSTG